MHESHIFVDNWSSPRVKSPTTLPEIFMIRLPLEKVLMKLTQIDTHTLSSRLMQQTPRKVALLCYVLFTRRE